LLVNEANRLLRNKLSAQAKAPIEAPAEQPQNYEEELRQLVDLQSQDIQEKDLLRVIIRYGALPCEGHDSVAHYIFHEIGTDEIEIEHPIISEVFSILYDQYAQGQWNPSRLTQHNNPAVTSLMAELLTDKYNLSPNWSKKYDVLMDSEAEHYLGDVHSAVNSLKLKHVEKLIRQNQEDFNKARTDEEIAGLQKVHMHLKQMQHELTKSVGTVIIK
jgi:DNA primase